MAARGGRFPRRERQAVGDAPLLDDDIEADRLLRHRMLYLKAGVDLEERDDSISRQQELHCASAGVADLGTDGASGIVDAGALVLRDEAR